MATATGGVKALRKIQLGKQSSIDTAVAATTTWRGTGLLEDDAEIKFVEEQIGIALPTTRNFTPKTGSKITLDPIDATFQQLPYLFEMGVAEEVATQDGAGTGYIYAYAMPTTAINALSLYTIEGGNNEQAEEASAVFCSKFKISGNQAEGVMMEGELIGRAISDTTFTGALTIPTLVPGDHINFGGSQLFIDEPGGTLGATEITCTLYSFELDVETGWAGVFANCRKDYAHIQWLQENFSATLKLVYKHNTTAETEKTRKAANTARQIRLSFAGNALGTPATESTLSFRVDAAGAYEEMTHGDVDGNDVKEATLRIGYDLTAALGLEFRVVNELTALP